MISSANAAVDAVYRSDWGRIVATLIRSFGDFDVAEEAAQDAFAAAVNQWPSEGVPSSPAAWIIQAAKHKAIDRLRRQTRFQEKVESYASEIDSTTEQADPFTNEIADDRLRLIFTCSGLLSRLVLFDLAARFLVRTARIDRNGRSVDCGNSRYAQQG